MEIALIQVGAFIAVATFVLGHLVRDWWRDGTWADPFKLVWQIAVWLVSIAVFFIAADWIWRLAHASYAYR